MNSQNQKGVGANKPLLPLESSREEEILTEASSGNGSPETIRYKGRYLYSKYNPTRSVLSLIQGTKFLPGTIVIICSPCLCYGTEELLNALDAACKDGGEDAKAEVCAIEADRKLYGLAKEKLGQKKGAEKIHFYFSDQLDEFEAFLNEKISTGSFRRVLRLDFSAGTQFNAEWYTSICNAAEQMVASYWKNRITIVKMGRLFSHNIFKNLSLVGTDESASDTFLQKAAGMVSKPIIVFGAGESLDKTFAKENFPLIKEIKDGRYFTIAVDAAAQALLARGIRPDAIVAVESQFAIQESYASFTKDDFEKIILFADLCSRPQVARLFKKRIWFASEYAKCQYLDSIKEKGIIQNLIPPLGSVGLTAVYLALVIRQSIATSVFVSGMDFSYSAGRTHAKNVAASKRLLANCTRKNGAANYSASLLPPAFPVQSKDESKMYSSPIMESYAINFAAVFGGQKNLYDIGECGIDLHLKKCTAASVWTVASLQNKNSSSGQIQIDFEEGRKSKKLISCYLKEEKDALTQLKDLLVKGENSEYKKDGTTLSGQILGILSPREYLFLHFPDGNRASTSTPFLKRVRAEIDSFLKILKDQQ